MGFSMFRARTAVVLLAGLSSCKSGPPVVESAQDLPVSPSASGPLARAKLSAATKDVIVLREDARFSFGQDGTKTYTYSIQYRIRGEGGLEGWSTISAEWSPWYQERPSLEAVVTSRDGTRHELDQRSVAEVPVGSGHSELYSDRRRLRAPLPGIEKGATVSQKIVYRDRRPFFDRGSLGVFYFGMRVPVELSRLTLDVPADLPFAYEARALSLEPDVDEEQGRRRLTFTVGPLPPIRPADRLLPGEVARFPHVVFSTARSWHSVAKRYAQIVEERVRGADVSDLIEGIPKTLPRRTLLAELLRRLHRRIRYTGIEFGEQAIIPWKPARTIARKYGDCKDKAAVLVAMLRRFDVDAHLALLRSGTTEDVVPGLPGLEGFNHAIVYVPGKEPIWIDATAEYAPVGQLPPQVQGRFAMIAAEDTTELVEIPASQPEDNRYVETREYYLADFGPMRVVERTEATGAMQVRLRKQFEHASRADVRRSLERYVRSAYRAEGLSGFRFGEPRDVSIPFSIEVEAAGAGVGFTASADAFVQLRNGILFNFLPDLLRYAALAGSDETEIERIVARELVERRSEDMELPEPYSAEVRFKVVPPTGYTLRALPEPKTHKLGPGEYVAKFKKRPDDVVEATFSFTTGKRRLTADEVRAFVAGLREAWEEPIVSLEFDHRGSRHMAEGRFREGLTEYRHLVELNADSALHHARMAEAMLRAGLGGPARKEAQKAVELDPTSSYASYALGFVLQHDLFGRPHAPGFDRDGAIEAFRRVKTLDPENYEARVNLAILYEHDEEGNRYRDREELDKAIAEYEEIREEDPKRDIQDNLLIALYWARRFDRIKALVPELEPSATRDGMMLVAYAATDGVKKALAKLDSLGLAPKVRHAVIDAAATSLAHLRFYPEARELAKIAARGAEDLVASQARLAMLGRLERFEDKLLPDSNPASVVQRILGLLFTGKISKQALLELVAEESIDGNLSEALGGMTAAFDAFKRAIRRSGVPLEMVRDNVLAATRFTSSGDDRTGYRVKALLVGPNGRKTSWWFVVKERGAYRLRASESSPHALAEEALHRLDLGDVAGARRWLDWAKDLVEYRSGEDPLTTHPFSALWGGPIPEPRGPGKKKGMMRIAAAALAVEGPKPAEALRILEGSRRRPQSPGVELRVDQALARAYLSAGRHGEALEAARRLRKRARSSEQAYVLEFRALYGAGRFEDARALVGRRLAEHPDDRLALTQLANVATAAGQYEEASRHLRAIIEAGMATPNTYNNLAWLCLFLPELPDDVVELALQANTMTRFQNPSSLHTLAAIYAEQGKTREAFQLLLKRMELNDADEPENVDWYLLGRIMEQYDLDELAAEAYRKVGRGRERAADSTRTLAERRLSILAGEGGG